MKKQMLKKFSIIIILILLITNFLFVSNIHAINERIENYEKEDIYLYDWTDSIVTTKTGIERQIPETFGKFDRSVYPIPEVQMASREKFDEILAENQEVMSNLPEKIANGTLKKHIAADGQFHGTVSDEAKAVEKILYLNTRTLDPANDAHSMGVYIPAGEIATITVPEEYLSYFTSGGIFIEVGGVDIGGGFNNATNYDLGGKSRMPYLATSFTINSTETKVGTPFGGMIYVRVKTNNAAGIEIPIKVTGAVDAPYYELGRTTKEEWDIAKNAPGIFAELRTPFQHFMVPSKYIRDIEDPKDILTYWMNVGAVSTYPYDAMYARPTIRMIFDDYIPSGAAVTFVNRWACLLPTSWASSSLSYTNMTQAGGWGTMHEFNHNWSGYNAGGFSPNEWGLAQIASYPSEVTNNVMSAMSYILYTNIASSRNESGTGVVSNWNRITDPYTNLKVAIDTSKDAFVENPFSYTTFAHEFGVEAFLEVVRSVYFGGTYNGITLEKYRKTAAIPDISVKVDDFANRLCVVAGKDMTKYMNETLKWGISNEMIETIKSYDFEEYFPIQNLYASGVKGIETGRPFYIGNVDTYNFKFEEYTESAGNIESIEISTPKYGTLQKNEDGTYTYKRNENIPEGVLDEFELTIKATFGEIENTRILPVKIGNETCSKERELPEEPTYMRTIQKPSKNIQVDINGAEVIQYPLRQTNDGQGPESIVDGNLSTYFHSAYNGTVTPFPHEYVIDFKTQKIFNQIEIYTRNNRNADAIGDYEIYVSNDNENWDKVAEDKTRLGTNKANNFTVTIEEAVNARYLKIVALNNKSGNKWTVVAEVKINLTANEQNNFIAQNSSKINYLGNWSRNVEGLYINGATYKTTNGIFQYAINGTSTIIYSTTNAKVQVKIDEEEWKEYNLIGSRNNASLIIRDLENKAHNIQVKVIEGEINLNLLSTDGDFKMFDYEYSDLYLLSEKYKINNTYMYWINPNTTVEELIKNCDTNGEIEVYNKLGQKLQKADLVGTGMTLKAQKNEQKIELILSVRADIDGNGEVTVTDLSSMNQQLVGTINLQTEKYIAADIDGNGEITVTDLSMINQIIVGTLDLSKIN